MTTATLRTWSYGLKLTLLTAAIIAVVITGIVLIAP